MVLGYQRESRVIVPSLEPEKLVVSCTIHGLCFLFKSLDALRLFTGMQTVDMISGALILLYVGLVAADNTIYASGSGNLASGWENWSWSSTFDFASTAGPGGVEAISVNTTAYGALSTKAETAFDNNYSGLRFDISGAQPDVSFYLSVSANSDVSPSIPLSAMSTSVSETAFTTITVDFGNLPGNQGVLANDTCGCLYRQHTRVRT